MLLVRPFFWLLASSGAIVDPTTTSAWIPPRCTLVVIATRDPELGRQIQQRLSLPDDVSAIVMERTRVYTHPGLMTAHAAGRLVTMTLAHENVGEQGDVQAVIDVTPPVVI
jgi:hypothetical protein